MSKATKLVALVSEKVAIQNFARLVDGDLSHIGDAILQGKDIHFDANDKSLLRMDFSASAEAYSIVNEWWEEAQGRTILVVRKVTGSLFMARVHKEWLSLHDGGHSHVQDYRPATMDDVKDMLL